MRKFLPKKFVCYFSLGVGCKFIGLLLAIVKLIGFIITSCHSKDIYKTKELMQLHTWSRCFTYSVTVVVYSVLMIVTNLVLIYAVHKVYFKYTQTYSSLCHLRKKHLMLWWLMTTTTWLLLTTTALIVMMVMYLADASWLATIFYIAFFTLFIFILIYFILIVFALHYELHHPPPEETVV